MPSECKLPDAVRIQGNPENDPERPGYSRWIENGQWKEAPTVSTLEFGGHSYNESVIPIGECSYGCGCVMGACKSGGTKVDPFGPCPMNPKTK